MKRAAHVLALLMALSWPRGALGDGLQFIDYRLGGMEIQATSPWTDGYDEYVDGPGPPEFGGRVYVRSYHVQGPDWTGPTAFYSQDAHGPIPWGGSTTWDPIYLWAQDSSPIGNRYPLRASIYNTDGLPRTVLTLDYVP